jgi:hypothetical protein
MFLRRNYNHLSKLKKKKLITILHRREELLFYT